MSSPLYSPSFHPAEAPVSEYASNLLAALIAAAMGVRTAMVECGEDTKADRVVEAQRRLDEIATKYLRYVGPLELIRDAYSAVVPGGLRSDGRAGDPSKVRIVDNLPDDGPDGQGQIGTKMGDR